MRRHGSTADSIERADATRLFVDRARRARPGFALTDEAADAVARICRRLDGIPLSIELAAARCRNLAIEQIARELDDRFRLLTGGARTVLERQQTLKASIDWSHDLLDGSERAALRRLGVFSGPFTMAAAEAVVGAFGDVDRDDVLDLVDRLADKSLIALDGVDATGESRYRLLETIRHYALDRLDDAGELTAARDAHADFWAGWAASHNVHLDCSLAIYDAIPPNLANLSAAARWACVSRPELLQALMLCIGPFLQVDDDEGGADRLFESALAALDGVDDIAWAHVAMAATFVRTFTWVFAPDDELRERAESIAAEHDLPARHGDHQVLTASALEPRAPERFVVGQRAVRAAGSPSWASFASAVSVRFYASIGQLAAANHYLLSSVTDALRVHASGGRRRARSGRSRRGTARRCRTARRETSWSSSSHRTARRSTSSRASPTRASPESPSSPADRDVLEWAADVSRARRPGAGSRVGSRRSRRRHLGMLERSRR